MRSIIKVLILFIFVHLYVLLTAFIYTQLEAKKTPRDVHLGNVLDKYIYKPRTNGPKKKAVPLPVSDKATLISELKAAFLNDESEKMRTEFTSLWKSYLFSFTTITTVGNSGLHLQTSNSRLFFFFTSGIGTILYIILLHNIAGILLGIIVQIAQFELLRIQNTPKKSSPNPFYASLSVFLMSYATMLLSILIIAIAVVVSGHSYLFGLSMVTDLALMIGNFHVLAYLYTWNEAGFVISLNMVFVVCHSFLYTAILATTHFVRGTKWEDLVEIYLGDKNAYKALSQDEEKPYQKFLMQAGLNHGMESGSDTTDTADMDHKSGTKDRKLSKGNRDISDPIVPTLLSPENNEFWEDAEEKTGKS
eukprot:gene16912-18618_t